MAPPPPPPSSPRSHADDGALDVTVLICTRNRAAQLAQALASAAQMAVPPDLRWELVVVDNGSSDDTQETALGFSDLLPIRVVREDTPGLSHARNRGVAEARGRYICWTDDDVLIDRDWLAAYAAAFQRHPEAAVFGGRIIPVLQAPSPRWFARLADSWPLTTLLAKRDLGGSALALDPKAGIAPWGANYAVRTAEQREVRYEPSLGVSPNQRRLGEEAEAIHQIMTSGACGWWVPGAAVQHLIPRKRQTLRYVFEYFASYGETLSHMEAAWPGQHHLSENERELRRLQRSPLQLSGLAMLNAAMFATSWLVGATRRSLYFLMRAGFYAGVATEAQARNQRS